MSVPRRRLSSTQLRYRCRVALRKRLVCRNGEPSARPGEPSLTLCARAASQTHPGHAPPRVTLRALCEKRVKIRDKRPGILQQNPRRFPVRIHSKRIPINDAIHAQKPRQREGTLRGRAADARRGRGRGPVAHVAAVRGEGFEQRAVRHGAELRRRVRQDGRGYIRAHRRREGERRVCVVHVRPDQRDDVVVPHDDWGRALVLQRHASRGRRDEDRVQRVRGVPGRVCVR